MRSPDRHAAGARPACAIQRPSPQVFLVLTAAFGLAPLIQIDLAGEAAMIEPDDWRLHVAWIHLFQWLSVRLSVAAYLARRSLGFAAFNCTPLVIIGLQYVLIHLGIEHAWAALGGLHAVCGALLVAYVALVCGSSVRELLTGRDFNRHNTSRARGLRVRNPLYARKEAKGLLSWG